ncbi:ATP-grasp fold amidoligase family protein [Psychrobacter sp. NPDC078631]|uniref:ATP-grasp fold amidoligase family protein n=1 Tax=Psychrobacter sp. NPDC078631 TaxID=3390666 RepID=UPI003D001A43
MFLKNGEKVFDFDEYEYDGVRFIIKKGKSHRLFIFFSAFTKKGFPQKYNYIKKIVENDEDSFIYFLDSNTPRKDPRGTYFLGDSEDSYLKSIIYILRTEFHNLSSLDIWFLGSSKGGSGALLACLELGIGSLLINAPQIKIGDYLFDKNPEAIVETGRNRNELNDIILNRIKYSSQPIDIYVCCGIEDSSHWFSHLKYLINQSNVNANTNIKVIPTRGGHDDISINDYSIIVDALINKDKILNDGDSLKRTIESFENRTSFFFEKFIIPELESVNGIKTSISVFRESIYKVVADSTTITILDYQSAVVHISGFEGIEITVYAKDNKGRIISKGGKYINYEHNFTLQNMDARNIHILTVFMKIYGEKMSFNLLTSLLRKVSNIEYYENDIEHLEQLSLEYSDVAQRVIRSKDSRMLKSAYVAPSFIDSSDATLIARNGIGYSFKTCITNALLRNNLPERNSILNSFSKKDTADFLSSKGYKVPIVYEYNADIKEVLKYSKCIVKPVRGAGSKGVFVKSPDGYLDLRDKELISDYESFEEKYKSYSDLDVIIEELISDDDEIARDIKIYSFYGASPIALEIIRSNDKNYYCYYDEDFNIINDCQDRERDFFDGKGFNKEIFAIAKEVSCLIPLPFIRVDFLVANEDYRLGELTPIPGFYSRFNNSYDKKLGKEYLLAENRLQKDLLQGKFSNVNK